MERPRPLHGRHAPRPPPRTGDIRTPDPLRRLLRLSLRALLVRGENCALERALRTLACGAGVFFSLSSAAWILLALQAALIVAERATRRVANRTLLAVAALILGIAVLEVAVHGGIMGFVTRYLALNAETAYYRQLIWTHVTDDILAHPLTGTGGDWTRLPWMVESIDQTYFAKAIRYGIPSIALLCLGTIATAAALLRVPANGTDGTFRALRAGWVLGNRRARVRGPDRRLFWPGTSLRDVHCRSGGRAGAGGTGAVTDRTLSLVGRVPAAVLALWTMLWPRHGRRADAGAPRSLSGSLPPGRRGLPVDRRRRDARPGDRRGHRRRDHRHRRRVPAIARASAGVGPGIRHLPDDAFQSLEEPRHGGDGGRPAPASRRHPGPSGGCRACPPDQAADGSLPSRPATNGVRTGDLSGALPVPSGAAGEASGQFRRFLPDRTAGGPGRHLRRSPAQGPGVQNPASPDHCNRPRPCRTPARTGDPGRRFQRDAPDRNDRKSLAQSDQRLRRRRQRARLLLPHAGAAHGPARALPAHRPRVHGAGVASDSGTDGALASTGRRSHYPVEVTFIDTRAGEGV